ncbi:MAG: HAMP domain-containing sensor histidine kinase [Ginsengibacter sp.]
MKKLRWLTILMFVTAFIITGFQVYWLRDSYEREKRILEIRANVNFQEAIRQLQISRLKLREPDTSHHQKSRVLIEEDIPEIKQLGTRNTDKKEIITMVNVMHQKFKDSFKNPGFKSRIIISSDNNTVAYENDSLQTFDEKTAVKGNKLFNYLYGIDSLQDTLKLSEIINLYARTLKEKNLSVPFLITRKNTSTEIEETDLADVTLGFANPITYHLQLGNTFQFLIKKITLPILFSLFLVGVTILSFVLLYRNIVKQQQLAEIKNDLISNITHELKTPISTAGVAIEALKNFNAIDDPVRTKEYLDITSNELQRLSLLVDRVLKLSIFEKKKIELKKEKFDLKQLLEEVIETLKLQFEKNRATVSLHTQGSNFIIDADKMHITSVIYNLLDNAMKYSPDIPFVNIELISHTTFIEFKVADKGIGIEKEYQVKIFDKFFRVPTGDKHNTKGYGLGLSYVAQVLREHKGFIEVKSEPGKGSIFSVKLPYAEAPVIYYDNNRKIRKISFKLP